MTVLTLVTEPRSLDEAIGLRARLVMTQRRMTAKALAPALGVSNSVLGRKLSGTVGWSADDVRNAARALGVSAAYLMGETSNPTPSGPTDGAAGWAPWDSNPQPTVSVSFPIRRQLAAVA